MRLLMRLLLRLLMRLRRLLLVLLPGAALVLLGVALRLVLLRLVLLRLVLLRLLMLINRQLLTEQRSVIYCSCNIAYAQHAYGYTSGCSGGHDNAMAPIMPQGIQRAQQPTCEGRVAVQAMPRRRLCYSNAIVYRLVRTRQRPLPATFMARGCTSMFTPSATNMAAFRGPSYAQRLVANLARPTGRR
jgi:hypothetical protein